MVQTQYNKLNNHIHDTEILYFLFSTWLSKIRNQEFRLYI